MTKYLLSIYQPDGPPPSLDVLQPIMKNVNAVREDTYTVRLTQHHVLDRSSLRIHS